MEMDFSARTSRHKVHLIKRIILKMQANAEGFVGHPEHVLKRAHELADFSHLRLTPPKGFLDGLESRTDSLRKRIHRARDPRLPQNRIVLTRRYKDKTVRVTVLEDGFEYDGEVYKSISAVARAVTGCKNINGFMFFQLGSPKEKERA